MQPKPDPARVAACEHEYAAEEDMLCLKCGRSRCKGFASDAKFDMEAFWASAPAEFADRFIQNLNLLLVSEGKAVGRLLDWIGVAEMEPQRERVAVLCAEFASRTKQMPFDDALALAREIAGGDDGD